MTSQNLWSRYDHFVGTTADTVQQSIMVNVTWRRFDQSAKQLIVGRTTKNFDGTRFKLAYEGTVSVQNIGHDQACIGLL